MIKKNLFLLFCFYLFVIQVGICGFLWQDYNFFWLAAINFVVIFIITICSKGDNEKVEQKQNQNHISNNNKEYEVKEEKTVIKRLPQTKKVSISNIRFFIIAILLGIFIWFRLDDTILHLRLLISIAGSFILYIILGAIFGSKILKTKLTLLYLILLILSGIRSIISFFDLAGNLDQLLSNQNTGEVLEIINEEDVIGTGIIDNSIEELSGELLTGENLTGNNISGDVEDSEIVEENTGLNLNLGNPDSLATFKEVLKFLFANTTLNTNTNIAFTNVSKSDENYAYFRTAYDKKMLGTDIQPNQKPSCETFVVMKGLAEGWNVGPYTNIKDAYWKYASVNGKLPDCKYGSYIKIGEMK